MKRAAIQVVLIVFAACASTAAIAQDEAASSLDLSVPSERIQFASTDPDANYDNLPPGAWRPITPEEAERKADGQWQVHGAVEAGVGWSKRGGNSNWQALNLNLGKTTVDDDGDTNHFNIDINVGKSDGPAFGPGGGYYGPGAYGPGYHAPAPSPGPMMRGRGPLVR